MRSPTRTQDLDRAEERIAEAKNTANNADVKGTAHRRRFLFVPPALGRTVELTAPGVSDGYYSRLVGRDTEALQRKIALLERDLDTAEEKLKEKTDLLAASDLKAEQFERRCRSLEKEVDDLNAELDAKTAELVKVKKELEDTLRNLDDI